VGERAGGCGAVRRCACRRCARRRSARAVQLPVGTRGGSPASAPAPAPDRSALLFVNGVEAHPLPPTFAEMLKLTLDGLDPEPRWPGWSWPTRRWSGRGWRGFGESGGAGGQTVAEGQGSRRGECFRSEDRGPLPETSARGQTTAGGSPRADVLQQTARTFAPTVRRRPTKDRTAGYSPRPAARRRLPLVRFGSRGSGREGAGRRRHIRPTLALHYDCNNHCAHCYNERGGGSPR